LGGPSWRSAWTTYFDDFEFVPYEPDLAVTTSVLNKDQSVDFRYSISGADLSEVPTVGLYWSTDAKYDKSDKLAFPVDTLQKAQGTYPVHVRHNQLSAPPAGTQYLLAVINPDVSIPESDNPSPDDVNQDKNNVQPLLLQSSLTIASPTQDDIVYMTSADGRTATVPLQAVVGGFVTGNVDWKVNLHYVSPVAQNVFDDPQPGSPPLSLSLAECVEKAYDYAITGKGGTLTLQASAVVNGSPISSDAITVEIRGYQTAPKDLIIKTLKDLYGSLYVGMVDVESKFYTGDKTGDPGRGEFDLDGIPYRTGMAVGLTQVNLAPSAWPEYESFGLYWDWQENASKGAAIFRDSLGAVDRRVAAIRKSPGNKLPALSQAERENWAMALYSGNLNGKDFYVPNASRTAWIINPHLPSGAKDYVNVARQRAFDITGDKSVKDGMISSQHAHNRRPPAQHQRPHRR
jgi:hypothetical protein